MLFQVSSQSLPYNVTTKRIEWRVAGHADRLALPQTFLDFCGSFPIYNIEETLMDAMISSLQEGGIGHVVNKVAQRIRIFRQIISFCFCPSTPRKFLVILQYCFTLLDGIRKYLLTRLDKAGLTRILLIFHRKMLAMTSCFFPVLPFHSTNKCPLHISVTEPQFSAEQVN